MTYQEIIGLINSYITTNGHGEITGARLNTVLNELAQYYGFDSVTVQTLPAGSSATATVTGRTLNLGIPSGNDGVDGQNAVNPFKGWWHDLATLKAAITAEPGDSAYVKDASPATTWSIYVYDATASSDNYWADSGLKADTSNVQTFASGEEVNEIYIDDTHLENPAVGSLALAEDVKEVTDSEYGYSQQIAERLVVDNTAEISEDTEKRMTGYIINSSGLPITTSAGDMYLIKVYDVSNLIGKKVKIISSANYAHPFYSFFKSSTFNASNLISKSNNAASGGAVSIDTSYVVVPQLAQYLIVSMYKNPCAVFAEIKPSDITIVKDLVFDEIDQNREQREIKGTTEQGKYANSSGAIGPDVNQAYTLYDLSDCGLSESVRVVGGSKNARPYYAFYYDTPSVNTLISVSANSTGTTQFDGTVQIPFGAKYLVVNTVVADYGNPKVFRLFKRVLNPCYTTLYGKKWACVGDSLTEVNQRTTLHYHDYIAQETGVVPLNYGKSGTGYAKSYNTYQPFYTRILDIDTTADIVTIFGSFNDLGLLNNNTIPLGSLNDSTTETMAGCINTTISNLYSIKPVVRLGIIAPTPWVSTQPSTSGNAYNYVEMIKAICERRSIPFLDLWRGSNLRPWDETFRQLAYSKDEGNGVHPDEVGHSLIAPIIRQFVMTLI